MKHMDEDKIVDYRFRGHFTQGHRIWTDRQIVHDFIRLYLQPFHGYRWFSTPRAIFSTSHSYSG